MLANKKLCIRKKNGCIQTIPLYTDKADLKGNKALTLRVGPAELYGKLVDATNDHASSLRLRRIFNTLAAEKREATAEKDKIHLTPKKRVLMYDEEKLKSMEEQQDFLVNQYRSFTSQERKEQIQKQLDQVRSVISTLQFEKTFYHQPLEEIPNEMDISALTDGSYMYSGCKDLKRLQKLDTSKLQKMQEMFAGCSSLPATFPYVLDLSGVQDVSMLEGMFEKASVKRAYTINASESLEKEFSDAKKQIGALLSPCFLLTQDKYRMADIHSADFTTRKSFPENFCCLGMTSLAGMYESCMSMTEVKPMETSWITDFRRMFKGCLVLPKEFPFLLDVSAVTDPAMMQDIFKDSSIEVVQLAVSSPEFAQKLTPEILGKNVEIRMALNISDQAHTMKDLVPGEYQTMKTPYSYLKIDDNFKDASNMFRGCTSLEVVDDENLLAADGITNTDSMFEGCRALKKAPAINMSKSRNAMEMFYGCESLTDIGNLNTRSAKTMERMFYGCKSLPKVLSWVIDAWEVGYATAFKDMFRGTPVEELLMANVDHEVRDDLKLSDLGENIKKITYYESVPWLIGIAKRRYQEEFNKIVLFDDTTLDSLVNIKKVQELRFSRMHHIDGSVGEAYKLEEIGCITGTEDVTSMRGLFSKCISLETLPPIDITSVGTAEALKDMLSGTNVKEIHFQHAADAVKTKLTAEILGKNDVKIVFDEEKSAA